MNKILSHYLLNYNTFYLPTKDCRWPREYTHWPL